MIGMIVVFARENDELYEEQLRHTYRAQMQGAILVVHDAAPTPTCDSNACYSSLDFIANCNTEEQEKAAQERLAVLMGKRDLRYLYRPKLLPRLLFVRRVPPIVFQPCWSSRRWKSLT